MPEGAHPPIEGTDDEPMQLFIPENKHEAGLRISKIGRIGLRRQRKEAWHDKRIAKLNKRLDAAKKDKSAGLALFDQDAGMPANELMEYMKRSWDKLTNRGSTKQVGFYSGFASFRNLPDRAIVNDAKAFMAEVRRKRKVGLLITKGKDKPNLVALNQDLLLAATFRTVTIEQRSSVTIRPKFGWGLLRTFLPRKMHDTLQIEELLGDEPLEWKIEAPGDGE